MSGATTIEWTDAVWNPVTGCNKVSPGCKNCYAERIFHRPYPGRAFTDVRMHPERLDQPLHWRKPRRIFVNSMSDLFHETVSEEFVGHVFAVMSRCPQHTFQVLTKRPADMLDLIGNATNRWGPFQDTVVKDGKGEEWPLPNVWLGVSVEDQKTADERIPILLNTPAALRFVSYEPALESIDLAYYLFEDYTDVPGKIGRDWTESLDWVIAGGESGPHARPAHPDWFRQIRDQCAAASVPFFFKQWGEFSPDRPIQIARDDAFQQSGWPMYRIGKKRAGRLLDGKEYNQFPNP